MSWLAGTADVGLGQIVLTFPAPPRRASRSEIYRQPYLPVVTIGAKKEFSQSRTDCQSGNLRGAAPSLGLGR